VRRQELFLPRAVLLPQSSITKADWTHLAQRSVAGFRLRKFRKPLFVPPVPLGLNYIMKTVGRQFPMCGELRIGHGLSRTVRPLVYFLVCRHECVQGKPRNAGNDLERTDE
jgi:hypothetical protein